MSPKTKSGEQITWKEFFHRWKIGMESITPLQQTKMQINSTWIIIIGLIAGIVISAMNIKTLWWLLLILVGGLGNTAVQQMGLLQKKQILMRFESIGTFDNIIEDLKGGINQDETLLQQLRVHGQFYYLLPHCGRRGRSRLPAL